MAAFAVVAFLGLLSVAMCDEPDQGIILRNCISKSKLSEDESKQLADTFMEVKDVSTMADEAKQVYRCVLSDMGLVDDKNCVKWEKVLVWYESQLPDSIRKKYMEKYKKDIMACDKGCKSADAKDLTEMMTATKCVFDFMRQVPEQMKQL